MENDSVFVGDTHSCLCIAMLCQQCEFFKNGTCMNEKSPKKFTSVAEFDGCAEFKLQAPDCSRPTFTGSATSATYKITKEVAEEMYAGPPFSEQGKVFSRKRKITYLNEEWVELGGDGKKHLYRAVKGYDCHGCTHGKAHLDFYETETKDQYCIDAHICMIKSCPFDRDDFVVRDLGALEDGALACPSCGSKLMLSWSFDKKRNKPFGFRYSCKKCRQFMTGGYETKEEAVLAANWRF